MITTDFHVYMALLLFVSGFAWVVALTVMYFQGAGVRMHPFYLLNRLLWPDRVRFDYIDGDRMVYEAAIDRLRPVGEYDRQLSGLATYCGIHGAGWIILKLREVDGSEIIIASNCRLGGDDPFERKGAELGVERMFGTAQVPVTAIPCNKYLMRVSLHDGTSLQEYVYRNFAKASCVGSCLPVVPGTQLLN